MPAKFQQSDDDREEAKEEEKMTPGEIGKESEKAEEDEEEDVSGGVGGPNTGFLHHNAGEDVLFLFCFFKIHSSFSPGTPNPNRQESPAHRWAERKSRA